MTHTFFKLNIQKSPTILFWTQHLDIKDVCVCFCTLMVDINMNKTNLLLIFPN